MAYTDAQHNDTGRPDRFTVPQMCEALRQAAGIKTHAANLLGTTVQTVRRYTREYPECQEAADEAVETNLDLAETKLLRAMEKGDLRAVTFYLVQKGRKRGYGNNLNVSADPPPGNPNSSRIDWSKMDPDELERMRDAIVMQAMESEDPDAQQYLPVG